jgi:hypothetical protein
MELFMPDSERTEKEVQGEAERDFEAGTGISFLIREDKKMVVI